MRGKLIFMMMFIMKLAPVITPSQRLANYNSSPNPVPYLLPHGLWPKTEICVFDDLMYLACLNEIKEGEGDRGVKEKSYNTQQKILGGFKNLIYIYMILPERLQLF